MVRHIIVKWYGFCLSLTLADMRVKWSVRLNNARRYAFPSGRFDGCLFYQAASFFRRLMKEHCFYIIKDEFFERFEKSGSTFKYNKSASRPTFCCFEDKIHKGLFWAIPTGRAEGKNLYRIKQLMSYDFDTDIRSSFYYLGYTNQKAIFYIYLQLIA